MPSRRHVLEGGSDFGPAEGLETDRYGRPIQDLGTWFNGRVVSIGIAEKYGGTREGMILAVRQERGVSVQEAIRIVDAYLGQVNATRTRFP